MTHFSRPRGRSSSAGGKKSESISAEKMRVKLLASIIHNFMAFWGNFYHYHANFPCAEFFFFLFFEVDIEKRRKIVLMFAMKLQDFDV